MPFDLADELVQDIAIFLANSLQEAEEDPFQLDIQRLIESTYQHFAPQGVTPEVVATVLAIMFSATTPEAEMDEIYPWGEGEFDFPYVDQDSWSDNAEGEEDVRYHGL